jgi:endonuclease/exonuclease/phosphatase family metal-dependent hydrolase
LCEAELGFRGTPVRIGVTHLSLERPLRAPQIQRIAEIIAGGDVPTILAGDFNVAKNDELRLLTEGGLQRANTGPTFPSWAPQRRSIISFLAPTSRSFAPGPSADACSPTTCR